MQRPATWKVATIGAAIAVAATLSAPIAQGVADTGGSAHSSSYGSQSVKREAAKFEPNTTTSRDWGPSQFGPATSAHGWAP